MFGAKNIPIGKYRLVGEGDTIQRGHGCLCVIRVKFACFHLVDQVSGWHMPRKFTLLMLRFCIAAGECVVPSRDLSV